jgi:uncharacterized damage-inducible protein DinB
MMSKIVEHMHWANATVIQWIKAEGENQEDHLKLASHVLNVEKIWICRMREMEPDPDRFKVHAIADLARLNDSNHQALRSLIGTDLEKVLDYRLFDGTPVSSMMEDLILHVFSHGFHHVGQMAAIAAKAGRKFPDVSYLGFTRRK